MKNLKFCLTLTLLLGTMLNYSQQKNEGNKVRVSGKIAEKDTHQPLEYTAVSLINTTSKKVTAGGITDSKGEFLFDAPPGTYDIKIEFMSFKPKVIAGKSITADTRLGLIELEPDAKKLDEVVIRSEKTTVEVKLDKKVYNVGKDLMVKGGTVSDVLDNIPSVSVSVEGVVSLRGNENVTIFIDGKPSSANNINDVLRQLPADAIDKVEVITNPSSRYDAEGGAGILNIILKKGKTNGLNGSVMGTVGTPTNSGLSGTINFKSDKFNLFSTQGFNNRSNPGSGFTHTKYLNSDNSISRYVDETTENERLNKGYNGNFGIDLFLDKSTTWTNIMSYRRNTGDNESNVSSDNYNQDHVFDFYRNRINDEDTKSENFEYSTNLTKNFKKKGHKLTFDGVFSTNKDDDQSIISDNATNSTGTKYDLTKNNQRATRNLLQTDYVLPIGKDSQFEAGYKGNFLDQTTDYGVSNNGIVNPNYTNFLEYKENINALYTQFGTKISKLSMLYGLRYENSDIDINQITSNIYKNKKYDNFFPSAYFTYSFNEMTDISLNYSKRINRPRGRQINPFSSYSSDINLFRGNPDLNPSYTNAIDFGYLQRWNKVTFNASAYYNITSDPTQIVRYIDGTNVNGIPVTVTTFINIDKEYQSGFEFTVNYTPYKWWRLNTNFNFFQDQTVGDHSYTYTDSNNQLVNGYQDFANKYISWTAKLTSKVTLPYKIDWQTNMNYNGPQSTSQGKSLGMFAMNLAFSKDVLKDKGTFAFNVNDVFNSRKRRVETFIPGQLESDSMMQFRKRQFTLSFTYRFNRLKTDKDKQPKKDDNGDSGDFQG